MSFFLYNKKNFTRRLEDMNFIFSWQKQYFTNERSEWVKYCSLENKIHIFAPPCNILYMSALQRDYSKLDKIVLHYSMTF